MTWDHASPEAATLTWDRYWINILTEVSKKSKDPSTKVGAVIVDTDNCPVSMGYNGFVRGFPEPWELWQRPTKYDYVIHAEMNAILNAKRPVRGCKMYISMVPCMNCAKHLAQAGISEVIYDSNVATREPQNINSIEFLEACGVIVRQADIHETEEISERVRS